MEVYLCDIRFEKFLEEMKWSASFRPGTRDQRKGRRMKKANAKTPVRPSRLVLQPGQ